jgi:hypothetical protein
MACAGFADHLERTFDRGLTTKGFKVSGAPERMATAREVVPSHQSEMG